MPGLALIHPMIVHFPIVLIVMVALTDLFGIARGAPLGGRGTFASLAAVLALAATASAAVAASLGDVAAEIAMRHGMPATLVVTHQLLGSFTGGLVFAWALFRGWIWWKEATVARGRLTLILAGDAVLVVMVLATALYGGRLVYDAGVNVLAAAG